jgi:leucyl aminopeptidase
LNKSISGLVKRGEISGKPGEITLLYSLGNLPADMVAVVGLGKEAELTLDRISGAVGEVCRLLRKKRAGTVAVPLLGSGVSGLKAEDIARAISEGAVMGLYTFAKRQSAKPEQPEIEKITIVGKAAELADIKKGQADGAIIAEAVNIARDMGNEPSNHMMPRYGAHGRGCSQAA